MANGFEKFFEAVGRDVKVVFGVGEKLVSDLPKFIKAAEDSGADVKKIIPLVQAVVAASLAFAKPAVAITAAVTSAGLNLAADEAAIGTVITEASSLKSELDAFVSAVKALAVEIGVDWSQLVADLAAPVATATPAA